MYVCMCGSVEDHKYIYASMYVFMYGSVKGLECMYCMFLCICMYSQKIIIIHMLLFIRRSNYTFVRPSVHTVRMYVYLYVCKYACKKFCSSTVCFIRNYPIYSSLRDVDG